LQPSASVQEEQQTGQEGFLPRGWGALTNGANVSHRIDRVDRLIHRHLSHTNICSSQLRLIIQLLRLTSPRMSGDDVRMVQQRLLDLGYSEVGAIDGWY